MRNITLRTRSVVSLMSMLAVSLAAGGCGSNDAAGEESVSPNVEVVDRSSQALTIGALESVSGTYTNCKARSGSWGLLISGVVPPPNPALSVVLNDAGCLLTLTGIRAFVDYVGTPSIALDTTFAPGGAAFATGTDPIAFYANAMLDSTAFAAPFTMTILYSDDLADTSRGTTASYVSVSSGGTAQEVPSPDYWAEFWGHELTTDANNVVQTSTGFIELMPNMNWGQSYVIDTTATLGTSFAEVDAAYAAGAPNPIFFIESIDASEFTLLGTTLPVVRNVIVLNEENGVKAYEVIRITFNVATN